MGKPMSQSQSARVIVLGNEKGGTGKSTTAMHLVVGLLRKGYRVASLDLDAEQGTLTRYLENRKRFARERNIEITLPDHEMFPRIGGVATASGWDGLTRRFEALKARNHFVVVDSPGARSELARHALSYADVLITPINDSFIDFDVLAIVEGSPPRFVRPSHYSETVWEARKARATRDGASIDWIVLRNRLSSIGSHNAKAVYAMLRQLSERIGVRLVEGFGERVIFRELFLQGLTVLDIRDAGAGVPINLSHVAARQEMRTLMDAVGLPREAPVGLAAGDTVRGAA